MPGPADPAAEKASGMAARVAAHDWAAHPWGVPESWPAPLRTAVELLLSSQFPMFLAWGPDLRMVYNDAYIAILGAKHPEALGEPFEQVWSDVWPVVVPLVRDVLAGTSLFEEDLALVTERRGFAEETYFTFSYSPIGGPDGSGLLCVVTETTGRVVGERRLRALRELGEAGPLGASRADACTALARVLDLYRSDVPFALFYLLDGAPDGPGRLVATSGVVPGASLAPPVLAAGDTVAGEVLDVAHTGRAALVTDLVKRHPGSVSGGTGAVGDVAPETVLVLPLVTGGERPDGLVVLGVSAHLPLDAGYRGFLDLVGQQVSKAVADAAAFEVQWRRAEELAELDRAKTAFFTNISHELRTPLSLMMGPVEELRAGVGDDPRLLAELDTVHRNGLRLSRLVTTLLDFSRLQAGRVNARFEPVDLAALTTELAGVFRSAMGRAGLRYDVDCPELGEPVFVDRGMWEQVVLNLLSNAIKFTFEGHVAVRLRRAGDAAVLTVADTGTGIPAAELPRLFERFHRVEGARARSAEGSGIGLALVAELVTLHGGTITADSTVDVGTTFTVTLPLGSAHLPAERIVPADTTDRTQDDATESFVSEALRWLPPDDEPATPRPAATGGTVLVADDNADMRDYLARLLSDRYRVQVVGDGAAALAAIRADPPDLVLSDVMMPELDGASLVAALRADTATAGVPVVLLSARAGHEAAAEGLAAGADDYLIKPFAAAELRARVAGHLRLGQLRSRVLEREQAAHRTLEQLQQATAALSAAATPQQVAAAAIDHLGSLLDTPAVAVWQMHGEDLLEQLDLGGWVPRIRADWVSLPVDAASPAGAAALLRKPVWVERVEDWQRHYPRLLPMVQGHGYSTIDCLPLLAGGRCLGVVAIGFVDERILDAGERATVLALTDQAAQALQRAELLAAESDARAGAEEFGNVVAALSSATTPADVGKVVLAHAAELGATEAVVVVRTTEPVDHLRVLAGAGPADAESRLPLDAAHPLAHVVRTGEPVWVGSRSGWAWRERRFTTLEEDLPAQVALPLLVGGSAIGAIGLRFGAEMPVFSPARRATLLTIAGQCAQALDRARLHQAEHDVAETLQRSLLPSELPGLERIAGAARYLPGAVDVQAGGDWYDLLPVDGTQVAVAVGDVVGQGAAAAAVMGQLRSALAGYLLDGHAPAAALERLDRFASRIRGAAGSTCACLVLDFVTGELSWATAGHLPVLVKDSGGARFLDGGAGTVLGVRGRPPYSQASGRLAAGSTVVLYTDGLVERRDEVIDAGLDRLRAVATRTGGQTPDELAEALVDGLLDQHAPSDDVALVVVRLVPEPLHVQLPATAVSLRKLRRTVAAWADEAGLAAELVEDLQFTVGEAAANAIEHAYPDDGGIFTVGIARTGDGGAAATVRDQGRWLPAPADSGHRGHGIRVMRRLAADFGVDTGPGGTEVRLRLPGPRSAATTRPVTPPQPTASASTRTVYDPPLLRIEGDLDLAGAAAVRAPLLAHLASTPGSVVDLTGVGYLSSAGIGLLTEAAAVAPGVAVRATAGSAPARILSLAGIDTVLTVR